MGGEPAVNVLFFLFLPGVFKGGVPYRITVTAVYSEGLAAAPSVWGFIKELGKMAHKDEGGVAHGAEIDTDALGFSQYLLLGQQFGDSEMTPQGHLL